MPPGSEESEVVALPCSVQETKQQAPMAAPQPAANTGVAVPGGKLKATAVNFGRPGAGGNMHVLGPWGHWQRRTRQLPTGISHPIIKRFGAQLLKKAQADPSKNGVAVPPAARSALQPVNKKLPVKAAASCHYSQGMVKNAVFSFLFLHK
ncbi:hypothetical protein VPH35_087752 [Triticum aestivum]